MTEHGQVSHQPWVEVEQPLAVVVVQMVFRRIEGAKVLQRIDSEVEAPAVVPRAFLCEVWVPWRSLLEYRSMLSCL